MVLPFPPHTPALMLLAGLLLACSDNTAPSLDIGTPDLPLDLGRDLGREAAPDLPLPDAPGGPEGGGDAPVDAALGDGDSGTSCVQVGVVDSQGDVGMHSSIVADSTGVLHVAYYDDSAGQLRYTTNKGGSWASSLVDGAGTVGKFTSIHVDATDKPLVAYYDATNKRPKLAVMLASGGWSVSSFDSATSALGTHLTGAWRDGVLHLAYYDDDNSDLRYARLDKSGVWFFDYVEQSPDDVGTHASLAAGIDGTIHAAYRDATTKDLRYAKSIAGGGFSTQTIDSQGDVGIDTGIALDAAGVAHIVYHDQTNGSFKHAAVGVAATSLETIETGGLGWYGALAAEGGGAGGGAVLHAAYYDYQYGALRYARSSTPGVWTTMSVDGQKNAQVGWDISLALVGSVVHLMYYDAINTNLRHAALTGCP